MTEDRVEQIRRELFEDPLGTCPEDIEFLLAEIDRLKAALTRETEIKNALADESKYFRGEVDRLKGELAKSEQSLDMFRRHYEKHFR